MSNSITTHPDLHGRPHMRAGLRRAVNAGRLARHLRRTERGARGRTDAAMTAPDGSPDPAGEAGMATAEYAVGTLAAAAFAGVLLTVVKSGTVKGILTSLITAALAVG